MGRDSSPKGVHCHNDFFNRIDTCITFFVFESVNIRDCKKKTKTMTATQSNALGQKVGQKKTKRGPFMLKDTFTLAFVPEMYITESTKVLVTSTFLC